MRAYIIVDVHVQDVLRYEDYKKLTPDSLLPFGGKFIVRGGPVNTLEGEWITGRIVVLEFPSKENAQAWWDSNICSSKKNPARSVRY
jgi:uncharacterized protein (DUF1330 family)